MEEVRRQRAHLSREGEVGLQSTVHRHPAHQAPSPNALAVFISIRKARPAGRTERTASTRVESCPWSIGKPEFFGVAACVRKTSRDPQFGWKLPTEAAVFNVSNKMKAAHEK